MMIFSTPVFLTAMGITLLEMSEAAAVGLALYAEAGRKAFIYVSLGAAIVLIATFLLGGAIAYLPEMLIRLIAAFLLLYFGLRLVKSARTAVERERSHTAHKEKNLEKGLFYTGFSVGALEAFETAIVLVALIPINFNSTLLGLVSGLVVVCVGTVVLGSQVRKIKQASMKIAVSSLLLAFSAFWFAESVTSVPDLLLIPLFLVIAAAVYFYTHRK
jgi:uncharacterized membrane protein